MKTGIAAGLIALSLSLNAWGEDTKAAKGTAGYKNDKQKFSYTVGYQVGQNLKRQNLDLDPKAFSQGAQDAVGDAKPRLNPDEMKAAVETYHKKEQNKQEAKAKQNLEAGKAFLEANKKKDGVVTLDSGLQYKVIAEGKGKQPTASDTVVAHYRGTTINGAEFDSSYSRNEPATFPLSGVIKGWQEALPKMKEGAKWQVYIPSELGYGPRGAGGAIGPNEVLIFDIELVSVKNADDAKSKKEEK